jgi:tetratricopeptide (TPR) repeat protein
MAREGIAALLCAAGLVIPLIPNAVAEAPPDSSVAAVLAVQQALKAGREELAAGQYGAAIHQLEQQLAKINGNREYLNCLRDAYRGYVKELHKAGRTEEAQTYLRRLEILDPGASIDFRDAPAVAATPAPPPIKAPEPPAPPPVPAKLAATSAPPPAATGTPTEGGPKANLLVRGKIDDPFQPSNSRVKPAAALVANADKAYREKEYRTASRLYEQAHEADPASVAARHDEWAYCKMFAVTQQFSSADGPALDHLEAEVKEAIALSPKLASLGKQYLSSIQSRRGGDSTAVRHLTQRIAGWSVAESDNFRIFHKENRELAEKVAQIAERTRRDMGRKWFDRDDEWKLRCDLYLHPTAADYSRTTGKPTNWTAHSTINLEGDRVVLRRIDLRSDDTELLTASLPHEATHTVLAGRFGTHYVPRWADEGMALLSEPATKRDVYRRKLEAARQDRLLFPVRELLTMEDYPERTRALAFYAQSVSLTEYLVQQPGGAPAFTRFVNEALKSGYDSALQKTYGLDMATLEQRWQAATFGEAATQAAFGGVNR